MGAQTLGIVVNSNRRLEMVAQLASAAGNMGQQVRIHFLGKGIASISSAVLSRLKRTAQMSVCEDSLNRRGVYPKASLPGHVTIVSSNRLIRILEECDRMVVL